MWIVCFSANGIYPNCFFLCKLSFLDPCAGVDCGYYGKCRALPNDSTECFCSQACPLIYKPVCGSDGNEYSNACVMRSTSCRMKVLITLAKDGPCKEPTEKPTIEPMKDAAKGNRFQGQLFFSWLKVSLDGFLNSGLTEIILYENLLFIKCLIGPFSDILQQKSFL